MVIWVLPSLVPDMWSQLSYVQNCSFLPFLPTVGHGLPATLMHITQHFKSNPQGFPRGTVVLSVSNGLKGAPVSVWSVKSTKIQMFLCMRQRNTLGSTLHTPSVVCLTLCTAVPVIILTNLNLNQSLWSGSAHWHFQCQHDLRGILPGRHCSSGPPPWTC